MSRYLLELAYNGTNYAGWQRQPNALTVEEATDTALSTVLGEKIKLVGCGRTDTGVHASHYAAHFDFAGTPPHSLLGRLNRLLPEDIALRHLYRVPNDLHARFSATERGYVYHISPRKDPFRIGTVTEVILPERLDRDRMHAAAALLLEFDEFAPFCKTKADNYTNRCDLRQASWAFGEEEWTFTVRSDRFLRGMIRLMVGMCLRVGEGKVDLEAVRDSLCRQVPLARPWSAPAGGLYLDRVIYPDRDDWRLLA